MCRRFPTPRHVAAFQSAALSAHSKFGHHQPSAGSQFAERELSQLAAYDQGRAGKIGLVIDVSGHALRIEDNPRSGKFFNQDTIHSLARDCLSAKLC
jgi:hypothetical protein